MAQTVGKKQKKKILSLLPLNWLACYQLVNSIYHGPYKQSTNITLPQYNTAQQLFQIFLNIDNYNTVGPH